MCVTGMLFCMPTALHVITLYYIAVLIAGHVSIYNIVFIILCHDYVIYCGANVM